MGLPSALEAPLTAIVEADGTCRRPRGARRTRRLAEPKLDEFRAAHGQAASTGLRARRARW